MATRAATLTGTFQRVTLGPTSKILGAGNYSLTGMTRTVTEAGEFGVDIAVYTFGCADGGTISMTDVIFDPTCPEQLTLVSAVSNAFKFDNTTTSGIRFWINTSTYLAIGTGGHILMTKAGGVTTDRCGLAKTSFEGQVSGAPMTTYDQA